MKQPLQHRSIGFRHVGRAMAGVFLLILGILGYASHWVLTLGPLSSQSESSLIFENGRIALKHSWYAIKVSDIYRDESMNFFRTTCICADFIRSSEKTREFLGIEYMHRIGGDGLTAEGEVINPGEVTHAIQFPGMVNGVLIAMGLALLWFCIPGKPGASNGFEVIQ